MWKTAHQNSIFTEFHTRSYFDGDVLQLTVTFCEVSFITYCFLLQGLFNISNSKTNPCFQITTIRTTEQEIIRNSNIFSFKLHICGGNIGNMTWGVKSTWLVWSLSVVLCLSICLLLDKRNPSHDGNCFLVVCHSIRVVLIRWLLQVHRLIMCTE